MSDVRGKARRDRNWIESILHYIPGFSGYMGKEERRSADKLLREQVASKIDQLGSRLDPLMHDASRGGGLAVIGDLDRLKKAVGNVADKIRFASYGYSGFFDTVKVRKAELDRLYEFDNALLQRVSVLEDVVNQLRTGDKPMEDKKKIIDQALSVTRDFDEHVDKRTQLITGYKVEE